MVKVVNVEMVVANVNKVDNFMMIFGRNTIAKQKLLFLLKLKSLIGEIVDLFIYICVCVFII